VIGKAGATLKDFRHDYRVDIKVFNQCCPQSTERLVQMIGKTSAVNKCCIAICKLLKDVRNSLRSTAISHKYIRTKVICKFS